MSDAAAVDAPADASAEAPSPSLWERYSDVTSIGALLLAAGFAGRAAQRSHLGLPSGVVVSAERLVGSSFRLVLKLLLGHVLWGGLLLLAVGAVLTGALLLIRRLRPAALPSDLRAAVGGRTASPWTLAAIVWACGYVFVVLPCLHVPVNVLLGPMRCARLVDLDPAALDRAAAVLLLELLVLARLRSRRELPRGESLLAVSPMSITGLGLVVQVMGCFWMLGLSETVPAQEATVVVRDSGEEVAGWLLLDEPDALALWRREEGLGVIHQYVRADLSVVVVRGATPDLIGLIRSEVCGADDPVRVVRGVGGLDPFGLRGR